MALDTNIEEQLEKILLENIGDIDDFLAEEIIEKEVTDYLKQNNMDDPQLFAIGMNMAKRGLEQIRLRYDDKRKGFVFTELDSPSRSLQIARYVVKHGEQKWTEGVFDTYTIIHDMPSGTKLEAEVLIPRIENIFPSATPMSFLLLNHELSKRIRGSSVLKIDLKEEKRVHYGSEAGFNEEFMLLGISGEPVEEKCNYSRIRLKYTVKCSFDKDEKARAREHMAKAQKLYNNLLERTHKILYNP